MNFTSIPNEPKQSTLETSPKQSTTHNKKLCYIQRKKDGSDWRTQARLVLQFFSEYPAMGGNPLLLEWHGSAMISRIGWEFVEGFLESISRLLGSGGRRKSIPICYCPWEKREFIDIDARWHNSKCISSTVSSTPWLCWSSFTGIAARPCRPL